MAAVRSSRAAKRAGRRIPDELMTITIDGDGGERLRRRAIICVAWCFEGTKPHAPSEEQEQGQEQRQKQIPPLRCGMKNAALRNEKQRGLRSDKHRGKGQYGDSGCARMTTEGEGKRFLLSDIRLWMEVVTKVTH